MRDPLIRIFFTYILSIGSLIVFSSTDTFGQVSSISSLGNLKGGEIEQLKRKVLSSGLSASQLEALAISRGYSRQQIASIKQKIYGTSSNATLDDPVNVEPLTRLREAIPDGIIFKRDTVPKSDIYGASIFANNSLDFSPSVNIATPESYILGPGDHIIIDIWGNAEAIYQKEISPDGTVRISDIGPIYLNGITISKAESILKGKLKSIYQSIGSTSRLSLSLGRIRTIKVTVVGEVNRPGSYTVSSLATVINVLHLAGGPNNKGSFRNIYVHRNGKKISEFDLYDYLQNGALNLSFLQDQDVIFVPTYANRVFVSGNVKRLGTYELKSGETVGDLLKLTGGFDGDAYAEKISILRNNRNDRSVVTANYTQFDSTILKDGDRISVKRISQLFNNRVRITGAVYQPGTYELKKGMMLSDLIVMAEGPIEDAFLKKGIIVRKEENFRFNTISFNLQKVIEKEEDIELTREDLVKISHESDLLEDEKVSIVGAVLRPGSYNFTDSLSLKELIFIAGGFRKNAHLGSIEISRRITSPEEVEVDKSLKLITVNLVSGIYDENQEDFILEPFDIVTVRFNQTNKVQPVVTIEGEVIYPGKYSLVSKDDRISDIFRRAGGVTPYAFLEGATLIRYSDYYDNDTRELDAIKRRDIKSIVERDSLAENEETLFLSKESVGFDIKKAINNPGSKFDPLVKNGDILSVPKRFQTIQIRGEVMKPGKVEFLNIGSFKKHLSLVGGQTSKAKMNRVFLVRANGQVRRTKSFLGIKTYPKVEAGSEIFIPTKPERRKVSLQEILALTGSVLSIILIVDRL